MVVCAFVCLRRQLPACATNLGGICRRIAGNGGQRRCAREFRLATVVGPAALNAAAGKHPKQVALLLVHAHGITRQRSACIQSCCCWCTHTHSIYIYTLKTFHQRQVGVHGSALFNAFYMPLHSSVVEIRPYGFSGEWPNMYMKVC